MLNIYKYILLYIFFTNILIDISYSYAVHEKMYVRMLGERKCIMLLLTPTANNKLGK